MLVVIGITVAILVNLYKDNRNRKKKLIADYIDYLIPFMTELNIPEEQIERLHQFTDKICGYELPKTKEEFEGQAMLYH